MNFTEAMKTLKEILEMLDKIYHALIDNEKEEN